LLMLATVTFDRVVVTGMLNKLPQMLITVLGDARKFHRRAINSGFYTVHPARTLL